ncbi:GNAT family N-acetyltransferase [Sporosarcina pasteurii]|uniref:Uncharacterized conserved protein n=1 Tax=Sporosarcina pasteurii TaxID=1474 RepID=A0A380C0L6_SPOPA|nr:GNAT family N-acetyltransferase [Sporosarcina pasteurii]MDS9471496.1 GNAT family N-acetyltransferase [Sporosarcina pasteurii]QBQ04884.1 GNAT family N-acetyltransferase [Sporosarcina pasteurii]SUJ10564.1 Uncharacterized conserved protein [Sporosarcina pasteurii]
MTKNLSIRKLESIEDIRLIQSMQEEVWGPPAIPTHQTYTASKNGGLVLGAFMDDEIIGFSYSFPGFADGKTYLCSHMLGIHPTHRGKGIGKLLKDEQRKIAIEMGYDLITWTFDPLESRNAYLNLQKLFGMSQVYLENCYGEMQDGLNKGLPSDRLQVEWWISSKRVQENWMPENITYERPLTVGQSEKGNPKIEGDFKKVPANGYGIEIPVPSDIQSIKTNEPELALNWRMKIRAALQRLFSAGYAVIGLKKSDDGVHYYQLVKRNTIPLTTKR